MSESEPLQKQNWCSPDILREERWEKRRINQRMRRGRGSVTEDDIEELRACIELGFDFDSPDLDPKLFSTFPALGIYLQASNSQYRSDSDTASLPRSIVGPGEDPAMVKAKLKQWAELVASSVRCSAPDFW